MLTGENELKNFILALLFIYSGSAFSESELVGTWTAMEKGANSIPKASYTIDLKQGPDGKIFGSYCFILQSGGKIDCSNDNSINIKENSISGSGGVIVGFVPFFGSGKGTAEISLSSGKLEWNVLATPSGGDYFGPMQLMLDRMVTPLNEAEVKANKAFLFDAPSDKLPPHGYLIHGDKVTLKNISDDAKYWEIVFLTKNAKSIRRWISCRDIGKCR